MAKPHTDLPRPRWRLIPLVILLILVVLAAATGFIAGAQRNVQSLVELPPATQSPSSCLPEPSSARLNEQQPWAPEQYQTSEDVWQQHAGEVQNYAEGVDGWLFLGDIYVENVSQAVGRETPNDVEVAAFRDRMLPVQEALNADGIDLAFLVAPAKWDVYPELLPEWTQPLRGATTADVLAAKVPEMHWINPRDALANAPERTYSPVNSHWIDYGGYVAWQYASDCLGSLDGKYTSLESPDLVGVQYENDATHNEFSPYGKESDQETWTIPVHPEPLSDYQLTDAAGVTSTVPGTHIIDMTAMPIATHNERSAVDASVLVVGDSTFTALAPYIVAGFRDVHAVRHQFGEGPFPDIAALAHEYDSDLVLMIVTERALQLSWQ